MDKASIVDMSSYLFFVWGWLTLVCDDPFWFGDQIGAGVDQVAFRHHGGLLHFSFKMKTICIQKV
jgi:hypothetical protein